MDCELFSKEAKREDVGAIEGPNLYKSLSLISLSLLIYFHIIVLSIYYIFIKLSFSQIYLLWILFWKIWSQSNSPPLRLFIYTWANKLFWIILVFCFMMTWMIWLNIFIDIEILMISVFAYWSWIFQGVFPFVQRKLCQNFQVFIMHMFRGSFKVKTESLFNLLIGCFVIVKKREIVELLLILMIPKHSHLVY